MRCFSENESIIHFFSFSVANGNFKRYILASENMKVGNLIKTYNEIPRNPVQVSIGVFGIGAVIFCKREELFILLLLYCSCDHPVILIE